MWGRTSYSRDVRLHDLLLHWLAPRCAFMPSRVRYNSARALRLPFRALSGQLGPLGRHLKSNLTSTHRSSAMGDRRLCLGAHCSVVKTGRARSARSRFGSGCCRTGSLVLRVFALSTIQFVWAKIGGGVPQRVPSRGSRVRTPAPQVWQFDIVQFKHPRKNQN